VRDYYDSLPEDANTLARMFSEAGYQTAFFGKWQLYERDPSQPVVGEAHARIVVPASRRGGFDYWEGFESGFLLNDPLLHGSSLPVPRRFKGYQSDVLVDRLLDHLRMRRGKRPLFAVLSLDAPHPPYAAPAAGFSLLEEGKIQLVSGTSRSASLRATARRELSGYYAHIAATDRSMGRLARELDSFSQSGGSLLAFTSTHGDMHGVDGKFRKGWPDEECVRVPALLVDSRGEVPVGREDSLLISLMDLGPSLLGLAGRGDLVSPQWQGKDLSGALVGGGSRAFQKVSMPSVPPFPKQCPYAWSARRSRDETRVYPVGAQPYRIGRSKACFS